MRVPWTRQPPGFTRLDLSHPLAKGIVSGIDARGWSLVGKGTSRAGTVNSTAPRPGGVALIGNNAGLISEQFTSGTPIDYPFTVVAYMSRITRTANNNFAAGLGNNGGNQVAVFQLSTSGGASNRFLYRNVNGGFSPATNYNVNASTSSDFPVVLSATINGVTNADIVLYWNGVNDTGSGINSPTSGTPAFDRFAIGGVDRSTDGFADTGNDVLFAFVTSKGWSAADHLAFAKNPWQIFEPIRVPFKAASSGVSGSGSPTNANDTSAGTGTTTVVGTSSTTNANDTSAGTGTTTVTGTVNYTNNNDTCAGSGTAGAITGTVNYTNNNDTAVGTGWAGIVTGTVNYTNRNDTSSGVGLVVGRGGITGDNRKKRRYVAKIGDRLVVFDSADRALNAIQRDELKPDAPIPVQSKKSLPKDAEQVQSIPVAEIKQTARVYDNEARLMQMFQRQRYAEMLALYESLKRQEDDDEIELLMLA